MRTLRIDPLGVFLEGSLINILLVTLSPGEEANVVRRIHRRICIHHRNATVCKVASEERTSFEKLYNDPAREELTNLKTYARDSVVFSTLLGEMHLAAVFKSHSYGAGENMCNVDGLKAVHCIQGAAVIPDCSPILRAKFRFLKQWDSDGFLLRNRSGLSNDIGGTKDQPPQFPLFSVSRLQISGLVRTLNAAAGFLPLIYLIEKKLHEAFHAYDREEQGPEGLLVASSDWSDFTLLVCTSSYDELRDCISGIASLTVEDVLLAWGEVIETLPDDKKAIFEIQRKALMTRYGALANCGNVEYNPKKHRIANHMFSQANTTPGVVWPFWEVSRDKTADQMRELGWNIQGRISGDLTITIKFGHGEELEGPLRQIAKTLRLRRSAMKSFVENKIFGYFDHHIPLTALVPGRAQRDADTLLVLINCFKVIAALAQRRAVGKKGRSLSSSLKGTALTIRASGSRSALLSAINTTRSQDSSHTIAHRNVCPFSIRDYLESLAKRGFGRNDTSVESQSRKRTQTHDSLIALKRLNTSRHLRDKYQNVVHNFQEQLLEPYDSRQALEMVDAYLTWHMAAAVASNKKTLTAKDAERMLRAFTEPLGELLNRSASFGARRSHRMDSVGERLGRTALAVSASEGLAEGVLALLGPVYFTGGLLRIHQRPNAESLSVTVPCHDNDEPGFDCTYAVFSINPVQASHPIHIGIILHEFLHPVTSSKYYLQLLQEAGPVGERMYNILTQGVTSQSDPVQISGHQDVGRRSRQQSFLERSLLNELLVGYLFAWMVCFDSKRNDKHVSGLYSQIVLLLLSLDRKGTSGDLVENLVFLAENTVQCYLVEQTLASIECPQSSLLSPECIKARFSDWWDANWSFLFASRDKVERIHYQGMELLLDEFLDTSGEFSILDCMKAIANATDRYFGDEAPSDGDLLRSQELRHEFRIALRTGMGQQCDQTMKQMRSGLQEEIPHYNPVHFVFSKESGVPNSPMKREPSLRAGRIEALQANLVLIRAFYTVLFEDLLLPKPGRGCMHLSRRFDNNGDGDADFSTSQNCTVLLDRVNGSLFTVGSESSRKYMSLRQAVALSMWQIGEVRKLAEVQKIELLLREFEKERLLLFLPDRSKAVSVMQSVMKGC